MFNQKEYMRKWRQKNKTKIKEHRRLRKNLDMHAKWMKKWRDKYPEKIKQIKSRYAKNNPWAVYLRYIKNRCAYNKHYKDRKVFLTTKELKELWFRDKAYLLECPSVDRKDNNGHYTFENCRFIERNENSRLGGLVMQKRRRKNERRKN